MKRKGQDGDDYTVQKGVLERSDVKADTKLEQPTVKTIVHTVVVMNQVEERIFRRNGGWPRNGSHRSTMVIITLYAVSLHRRYLVGSYTEYAININMYEMTASLISA